MMVTAHEHPKGSREGQPLVWGNRAMGGRFHVLGGASLTLGLQFGQDGLGPADGGCREGLHALLRRVADGLDVGVALLGGSVGCRHHVAGGADEGHVGHAVHHAGLREKQLRWGLGVGGSCWARNSGTSTSPLTHGQGNSSAHPAVCSTKLQEPGPSGLH